MFFRPLWYSRDKEVHMKLISFAVFVVAAIAFISVLMNAEGLFSIDGDGFSGFADMLFNVTQALAIPIILGMLGLIGLRLSLSRRD